MVIIQKIIVSWFFFGLSKDKSDFIKLFSSHMIQWKGISAFHMMAFFVYAAQFYYDFENDVLDEQKLKILIETGLVEDHLYPNYHIILDNKTGEAFVEENRELPDLNFSNPNRIASNDEIGEAFLEENGEPLYLDKTDPNTIIISQSSKKEIKGSLLNISVSFSMKFILSEQEPIYIIKPGDLENMPDLINPDTARIAVQNTAKDKAYCDNPKNHRTLVFLGMQENDLDQSCTYGIVLWKDISIIEMMCFLVYASQYYFDFTKNQINERKLGMLLCTGFIDDLINPNFYVVYNPDTGESHLEEK